MGRREVQAVVEMVATQQMVDQELQIKDMQVVRVALVGEITVLVEAVAQVKWAQIHLAVMAATVAMA
jgi:hypothetical protein